MKNPLQHITLHNFKLNSGQTLDVNLSYQLFGRELFSAPIILVNHALTGNSNVAGEKGWWKNLVGEAKVINTHQFTILCFNIPGNGFDGTYIENYPSFTTADVARIFLEGLLFLNITHLHTLIGGSLGGSIAWEMLAARPAFVLNFIAIACDFRTSDWLHSQCLVQKFLLAQTEEPLQKARIHAMLCYRTPESLNERFNNELDTEKEILKSHDWLNFHGKSLNDRFSLKSYRLMNNLLMNIHADPKQLPLITANIHLIAVDSDLLFTASEMKKCYEILIQHKENTWYHEIKSMHGHDAFLIEYEQLNKILEKIIQ